VCLREIVGSSIEHVSLWQVPKYASLRQVPKCASVQLLSSTRSVGIVSSVQAAYVYILTRAQDISTIPNELLMLVYISSIETLERTRSDSASVIGPYHRPSGTISPP